MKKGTLVALKLREDGKFIVEGFGNNWDSIHDNLKEAIVVMAKETADLKESSLKEDMDDCAGWE